MSTKKVLIMMAAYNGAAYLSGQIRSLLEQSFPDFDLIIQDDGSSDGTAEILSEFAKQDPRIRIRKNPGPHHGAYYNFHALANYCKTLDSYDYYLFCDQDDIWMKDKIRFLVHCMERRDSSVPLLGYADMDIIDGNDRVKGSSVNRELGIAYKNRYSVFFSHNVFGCNLIMNRNAFFSVPFIDTDADYVKILSHDNLYAKFAAARGRIFYIPRVTMHYRRHADNVTGKQDYSFGLKRILKRIAGLDDLAKDHALTYNQSLIALRLLEKQYHPAFCREMEDVIRTGGIKALLYVMRHRISWGKPVKTLSRSLILLTGRYRKYLMDMSSITE